MVQESGEAREDLWWVGFGNLRRDTPVALTAAMPPRLIGYTIGPLGIQQRRRIINLT